MKSAANIIPVQGSILFHTEKPKFVSPVIIIVSGQLVHFTFILFPFPIPLQSIHASGYTRAGKNLFFLIKSLFHLWIANYILNHSSASARMRV